MPSSKSKPVSAPVSASVGASFVAPVVAPAVAIDDSGAAAPAAFKPIRSARAFEEIATQIRNELIGGRLKVGSRLPSERALSEQFGVSRNTLREALRSLEHAGLIRLQKGASGGAFISERSGDAIVTGLLDMYHLGAVQPAQLTEARIWLESVIVREACVRATPADIDALHTNIAEAAQADASGDFPLRARKHLEFHRILTRMTGNPIMMIVMSGVLDVLQHFIDTIGDYQNTFVLPSRRRFMKHMEEGDVHAAVDEMEASLKRLQRSYLSRVEAAPAPTDAPAAAAAVAAVVARKRVSKPASAREPAANRVATESVATEGAANKSAATQSTAAKSTAANNTAAKNNAANNAANKSVATKRVATKRVASKRVASKSTATKNAAAQARAKP